MTEAFRFIVVADSHIRPPDQEVDAYPSNALMVRRNEYIVDLCNRIDAAFIVHLGDIVHPLPVEDTHAEAIDLAKGVYAELRHPIHFVAGNHDVGDKPNALVAVPAVAEENYPVFEEAWGPSYYSFDVGECHFVTIDTQVMNSGLVRDAEQRNWLIDDLNTATGTGSRIFMFTHYPPFVRDRQENEHYDNLGEPARSWFLDLIEHHDVEAVFSGHVHNFLYNRHGGTDLYVAPSTGFVRPDYAELASVPPRAEYGRDDPPKLGIFVVDVTEDGHTAKPLRSFGMVLPEGVSQAVLDATLASDWESPVGVTLRHGWQTVTDFPTAGLDEFNRKQIRNDALILALWEARINDVRVPLSDASTTDGARRLRDLAKRGMRFSVFSAGVPTLQNIEVVQSIAEHLCHWQIISPSDRFRDVLDAVRRAETEGIDIAIAPIVPLSPSDSTVHHFVSAGFGTDDDPLLRQWLDMDVDGVFGHLMFRIPWPEEVGDSLAASASVARGAERRAVVVVDLPRGTESSTFDDDEVVARRVVAAAAAAMAEPDVAVFLDAFVDHDRGYYPRHGLIDRSFNPRPALYDLIAQSSKNS